MKNQTTLFGCIAAATLCLAPVPALAQQLTNEAQLWTELGVRYEPARRLRLSLDQHFRFHDNISRGESLMTEVAVRYGPERWWRIAGGYRFVYERDNDGFPQVRHRMHLDVTLRARPRPWTFDFRLRFQEQARAEDDDGAPWRHVLRLRAGAELDREPLYPFVDLEIFLRLAEAGADPVALNKLRATIGLGIETRGGDVSVAYRGEAVLEDNALFHIIVVSWHYEIDP